MSSATLMFDIQDVYSELKFDLSGKSADADRFLSWADVAIGRAYGWMLDGMREDNLQTAYALLLTNLCRIPVRDYRLNRHLTADREKYYSRWVRNTEAKYGPMIDLEWS